VNHEVDVDDGQRQVVTAETGESQAALQLKAVAAMTADNMPSRHIGMILCLPLCHVEKLQNTISKAGMAFALTNHLGDNQRTVWATLGEMFIAAEQADQEGRIGLADAIEKASVGLSATSGSGRRKKCRRAIEGLLAHGLLVQRDGWLCRPNLRGSDDAGKPPGAPTEKAGRG
jgi:hypothetical protein